MRTIKLLFTRESLILQPLRCLVEEQNHRTLVLWVIDCSNCILSLFEKAYPDDKRPYEAVEAAKLWSQGKIKMPEARKKALQSHQAATDVKTNLKASAAARAIGHVVGTVHVETHALGVVFYGLTAFYYAAGKNHQDETINEAISWFYERLIYWSKHEKEVKQSWVPFLLREEKINKEKLLRIKKELKKEIVL